MKRLLCLVPMLALLTVGIVVADDAAAPSAVTVSGTNYGLIATLAPGAEAAPALAKLNALKVTSAKDAAGKEIEGLKGKTLFYLPTKAAEPLILGDAHAGKDVTVHGKLHSAAGVLEVEKFEAAGGGDEFDDLPVGGISGKPVI